MLFVRVIGPGVHIYEYVGPGAQLRTLSHLRTGKQLQNIEDIKSSEDIKSISSLKVLGDEKLNF